MHTSGQWFDELMTPPAVAALLGVSPPTVYAAIQRSERGLGHIRTPGNQIRVRRREVLAYCHRTGTEVPVGLVPTRSPIVVLHPERSVGQRIREMLEPACQVEVYTDEIEGLISIGKITPPQVLLSDRFGKTLIRRLCMAINDMSEIGYMSVLLLVGEAPRPWRGGIVPLPLQVKEPRSREDKELPQLISTLLGLE